MFSFGLEKRVRACSLHVCVFQTPFWGHSFWNLHFGFWMVLEHFCVPSSKHSVIQGLQLKTKLYALNKNKTLSNYGIVHFLIQCLI